MWSFHHTRRRRVKKNTVTELPIKLDIPGVVKATSGPRNCKTIKLCMHISLHLFLSCNMLINTKLRSPVFCYIWIKNFDFYERHKMLFFQDIQSNFPSLKIWIKLIFLSVKIYISSLWKSNIFHTRENIGNQTFQWDMR